MRFDDRQRLILKGLATTAVLHPASLVFAGFPPVPASRRASAQTQALRFGGMTESEPVVYLVQKANLPSGLLLSVKTTTFAEGGKTYRLDALDNEPTEPHVRLTANLADR